MSLPRSLLRTMLLTGAAAAAGCGGVDHPPTYRVTGLVTYKGEPVPGANVAFNPKQGRPATGTTDETGHFKLTTFKPDDGAFAGEHVVTVTKTVPKKGKENDVYAPQVPVIPPQFGHPEKSPLRATVEAGSNKEIEVKVPG